MTFFWLIPLFLVVVIALVILYYAIMKRPRTPAERAEAPDQIRQRDESP